MGTINGYHVVQPMHVLLPKHMHEQGGGQSKKRVQHNTQTTLQDHEVKRRLCLQNKSQSFWNGNVSENVYHGSSKGIRCYAARNDEVEMKQR
jgi:hypothetical protein